MPMSLVEMQRITQDAANDLAEHGLSAVVLVCNREASPDGTTRYYLAFNGDALQVAGLRALASWGEKKVFGTWSGE